MKNTFLLNLFLALLLLLAQACTGRSSAVGTGESFLGGGNYASAKQTIRDQIVVATRLIDAGAHPEAFCRGVDVPADAIPVMWSFMREASGDIGRLAPAIPFDVTPQAITAYDPDGNAHPSRATLLHGMVWVNQSAFDAGDGWWLALHEMVHAARKLADFSPMPSYPKLIGQVFADKMAQCTRGYFVALSYPGALDIRYGDLGVAAFETNDAFMSAVRQPDGKLVALADVPVTFNGTPSGSFDCRVRRFTVDGALDETFGDHGSVVLTTDRGTNGSDLFCRGVVIGKDGAILIGGTTRLRSATPNSKMFLQRLTASGAIDPALNGGDPSNVTGRVFYDYGGSAAGLALAADESGSLYLAGSAVGQSDVYARFAVAKFRPSDGTLDPEFGGRAVHVKGYSDVAFAITLQNGRVFLTGRSDIDAAGSRWLAGVAVLDRHGNLDTTFGDVSGGARTGTTAIDLNAVQHRPAGIAVDSSGRVIVAGTTWADAVGTGSLLFLARLSADGSADSLRTTFTFAGSTTSSMDQMKVLSGDRIAIAGSYPTALGMRAGLLVLKNGEVDASFSPHPGETGDLTARLGAVQTWGHALVPEPDGRLDLLGAYQLTPGRNGAFLARFLGDTAP